MTTRQSGRENPADMAELVDRARRGDAEAVSALYEQTYGRVYYTVKSMIKNEDDVLDVLQDAYVKAFTHLERFEGGEKFLPWVKQIAANAARDWLRRKTPALFGELTKDETETPAEERIPDDRPASLPEASLDAAETARLVREILDTLPDEQRAVVGMYYYEELSVKEIAEALGVSESAVKSRVKGVLNYRKPAFWLIVAAIAAVIALAVFFLTDPAAGSSPRGADELPGEPLTAVSENPAPAPEIDTPDAGEYSPAVSALLSDLERLRGDELAGDERLVRESVRIYLEIKSELEYHPGWKEPDFDIFFDTGSPDYAALAADVGYSREMGELMAGNGLEVLSDSVSVDFSSVEINGDTASVDCYCTVEYLSASGGDTPSADGCRYWIELSKVDGVWLFTDLSTPPRNY